jgi:predicted ATP-grasp superfamily ATP-dependent carboligase
MNSQKVIIVLGGGTNAIGQIRAAHQANYCCINIVEKSLHSFSRKSRFCKGYLAPHPYSKRENCIQFILDIIKNLDTKPYLFFASDDWMDLIGENENIFRQLVYLPQSEWKFMSLLFNKKYLYRIAGEYNIPYPKTSEFESLKTIIEEIEKIKFPCIVKPQLTISQNEITKSGITVYHRTQKFENKVDLVRWINLLLQNQVNFPVVMQEYIPGTAETLYTLTSYSSKNGSLIAGSIGRKLRQFPPSAGRITSGILEHNQDLFALGKHFLKSIKYHGLANTEFKYDERDGQFKLMEINARLGAWNYSSLYAGINFIKIAVEDEDGIRYTGPEYKTEKDGRIWYNAVLDCLSAIYLNRKIGEKQYQLSIINWFKSIKRKGFESLWSVKDPMPFFYNIFYLAKGFFK